MKVEGHTVQAELQVGGALPVEGALNNTCMRMCVRDIFRRSQILGACFYKYQLLLHESADAFSFPQINPMQLRPTLYIACTHVKLMVCGDVPQERHTFLALRRRRLKHSSPCRQNGVATVKNLILRSNPILCSSYSSMKIASVARKKKTLP